jgi:hypothetical protein
MHFRGDNPVALRERKALNTKRRFVDPRGRGRVDVACPYRRRTALRSKEKSVADVLSPYPIDLTNDVLSA